MSRTAVSLVVTALVALALVVGAPAAPAVARDDDVAALLAKGRARLDAGELDEAVAVLRRARDLDASAREVAETLAVAIARRAERVLSSGKGDRDAALGELDEAVRLAPERWDVLALQGIARFMAEDYEGSERALASAIEKGAGDQPRVLVWHAHALYRLGKHGAAIAAWKEARVAAGALEAEERDALVAEIDAAVEKARREQRVEGEFDESLSSHFRITWDGKKGDPALGGLVADLLEDAYNTIGYDLDRYPKGEVPVVVYSEKEFHGAVAAHGWVGGLFDGKIRVPVRGARAEDRAELRVVILHEFTHALLQSVARGKAPIWFQEGMAQHYEGRAARESEAALAELRRGGQALPTLAEMSGGFVEVSDRDRVSVLYAVSHLLVEELLATSGPTAATDYLDALGEGKEPKAAFERAFGSPFDRFYDGWRARR